MSTHLMDDIAKTLAGRMPRRQVLKLITAGISGAVMAHLGVKKAAASVTCKGSGGTSVTCIQTCCNHTVQAYCCDDPEMPICRANGECRKNCPAERSCPNVCCKPNEVCTNGQCVKTVTHIEGDNSFQKPEYATESVNAPRHIRSHQ